MTSFPTHLFILSAGAILVWLVIISFLLYKTRSHYNNLVKGITKQNLSTILEKMLSEIDLSKKELVELSARCDKIEHEGIYHAQKIGLLRFNPFADTGGDQSFIVAILNGQNDGIILSSLHGRTGTRWYFKKVKGGAGVEHELSSEEKTAIKNAKAIA